MSYAEWVRGRVPRAGPQIPVRSPDKPINWKTIKVGDAIKAVLSTNPNLTYTTAHVTRIEGYMIWAVWQEEGSQYLRITESWCSPESFTFYPLGTL